MTHKKLQPEEIEKLLLNGRRLSSTQIASRLNRQLSTVYSVLGQMVKDGRVKRMKESVEGGEAMHYLYFTEELQTAAPRNYKPNLTEDLKGYVDNLMQFANLALATRR